MFRVPRAGTDEITLAVCRKFQAELFPLWPTGSMQADGPTQDNGTVNAAFASRKSGAVPYGTAYQMQTEHFGSLQEYPSDSELFKPTSAGMRFFYRQGSIKYGTVAKFEGSNGTGKRAARRNNGSLNKRKRNAANSAEGGAKLDQWKWVQ
jgi:hypothetical protein